MSYLMRVKSTFHHYTGSSSNIDFLIRDVLSNACLIYFSPLLVSDQMSISYHVVSPALYKSDQMSISLLFTTTCV
jgi:positive regulator of sigma E activity